MSRIGLYTVITKLYSMRLNQVIRIFIIISIILLALGSQSNVDATPATEPGYYMIEEHNDTINVKIIERSNVFGRDTIVWFYNHDTGFRYPEKGELTVYEFKIENDKPVICINNTIHGYFESRDVIVLDKYYFTRNSTIYMKDGQYTGTLDLNETRSMVMMDITYVKPINYVFIISIILIIAGIVSICAFFYMLKDGSNFFETTSSWMSIILGIVSGILILTLIGFFLSIVVSLGGVVFAVFAVFEGDRKGYLGLGISLISIGIWSFIMSLFFFYY